MTLIKYCGLLILLTFLLIPQIVLIIELHKYRQHMHTHTMSLVTSNFVGFFPAIQCMYYTLNKHYMIHEFILFYLITFTSGTYHMCNKLNHPSGFCSYTGPDMLMYLDYINSYFCIITTILYLAKFEFMNDITIKRMIKFTIYLIEYVIVLILTVKYRLTVLPSLFTSLTLLVVLLMFVNNRNQYAEIYFNWYKFTLFMTGFAFGIIAFVTYLYISINGLQDETQYWFYHSYLWHIPVLLCPVFIIESSTVLTDLENGSKRLTFFEWIAKSLQILNFQRDNIVNNKQNGNYELTPTDSQV